jgi:CheY-like chemotaxis protein
MFNQVEPSLGGLGIGLFLAKRLVEMHGGTIEAHSPGHQQGSEFVVRLPLAVESPFEPVSFDEMESASSGSRLRVLIADNDPDIVLTFEVMLQSMGHDVVSAANGLEALELAARVRPDAAVLDIGMTVMDGYEAARRIRKQPWGANMVLIAITGWGHETDRRRSEEAGFDSFIVKPVDVHTIADCLKTLRSDSIALDTNEARGTQV